MTQKRYFPYTATIDGDEVRLRLSRLNFDEALAFKDGMEDLLRPVIEQFVSRQPDGPEQERDEKGDYVVSFEAICEQRRTLMTPDQREALREAERAHEARARVLVKDVFTRFVDVERGPMIEQEDGKERALASGVDFLDWYAMRDTEVWLPVVMALFLENTLNADQKKVWQLPAASRPSSAGRRGHGPRRKTTAARVATAGSAATADVTATPAGPSGSTARSSSPPAPSVS